MYNRPRKSTLTECCEFPPPPSPGISGPCRLFIAVVRMLRFTTTHPLRPGSTTIITLPIVSLLLGLVRCHSSDVWCLYPGAISYVTVKRCASTLIDDAGSMRMNHHPPSLTYSFLFILFFICSFLFRFLDSWRNNFVRISLIVSTRCHPLHPTVT